MLLNFGIEDGGDQALLNDAENMDDKLYLTQEADFVLAEQTSTAQARISPSAPTRDTSR